MNPGLAVLGPQPLEDPLRRVPLLARPLLVLFQSRVDYTLPGPQFRPARRFLAPITRRHRVLQHLAHRLPRQAKLTHRRPPAHPLDQHRTPYSRIQLHGLHPSISHRKHNSPAYRIQPGTPTTSFHLRRIWRVDYFYPATKPLSRAVSWPIFTPPRTPTASRHSSPW